jgi:pyruvate formate lyase activating enzyme
MKKGIIFDIKRYAIHDGPGIRTTVFFKGCPLRCLWCHNPEGLVPEPELTFIKTRCLQDCNECVERCTRGALSRPDQYIFIDREECDLCGDCVQVCPTEALEIIGKWMSTEEVINEIEKDMIFHDGSKGGVTFSGGEPLMQPEFLNALLEECKKKGIHTSLDTSGYATFENLEKIKDKVDLFLYDIKMIDDEKHKKTTGVSNKSILDNLRKLSERGNNIVVRIPVIPGINNTDEDISEIAEFITTLKEIKEICLLPYHNIAKHKYEKLNRPFMMKKTEPLSEENKENIKKKFEYFGFKVRIGE